MIILVMPAGRASPRAPAEGLSWADGLERVQEGELVNVQESE